MLLANKVTQRMKEKYQDGLRADARLFILETLSRQIDGRLNDSGLTKMLDSFGWRRTRDWVRTQIRALSELGAVEVEAGEGFVIARLTEIGRNHVDQRSLLEGVSRPRDPA